MDVWLPHVISCDLRFLVLTTCEYPHVTHHKFNTRTSKKQPSQCEHNNTQQRNKHIPKHSQYTHIATHNTLSHTVHSHTYKYCTYTPLCRAVNTHTHVKQSLFSPPNITSPRGGCLIHTIQSCLQQLCNRGSDVYFLPPRSMTNMLGPIG